jgi:hypothetical protein
MVLIHEKMLGAKCYKAIGQGVALAQGCFRSARASISQNSKECPDLTDEIVELRGRRVTTSKEAPCACLMRDLKAEAQRLFIR